MEGNKLKRYLKLFKLYAMMDLAWLLRDSKIAVASILADLISSVAAMSGIFLLAMRFDGIGSIDKFEVLFMLGYATIITGIFQIFLSMNNVGHISRRIGRGQFEHMFIQPIPMSLQLSTEGFIPFSGSSNFVVGIIVVIVALSQLHIVVPFWWILSFVFNILLSITILLSLSYLASSLAFYSPVTYEEISSLVIDNLGSLSNFPLSGMPKWITIPLITIFPYGLMAWFPSMVLLGKPPLKMASLYPVIIAVVLFVITYFAFKKGFKYYVNKGSNRYSSFGHRR